MDPWPPAALLLQVRVVIVLFLKSANAFFQFMRPFPVDGDEGRKGEGEQTELRGKEAQ